MTFESYIKKSIEEIENKNFSEALKYIHLAMLEDHTSPKPHNLIGIIAELNRNLLLAEKHYRAAYALDPTFKACWINLERITSFYYEMNIKNIDFGDNHEEREEEGLYTIQYDCNNVGHVKKRILCIL